MLYNAWSGLVCVAARRPGAGAPWATEGGRRGLSRTWVKIQRGYEYADSPRRSAGYGGWGEERG